MKYVSKIAKLKDKICVLLRSDHLCAGKKLLELVASIYFAHTSIMLLGFCDAYYDSAIMFPKNYPIR
jgi:hypothetical protein